MPLKLRHTNRDQIAYDEVMLADIPVEYDELTHRASQLSKGHRYFAGQVETWLAETSETEVSAKAGALASVLTQSLEMVVIGLTADENSQEIFETLNARGTPLTAADPIKNFVFQRLEPEGVETEYAYKELWPYEQKFWEREVRVGRYPVSRSSLFLNQWLVSRLGEEIRSKTTLTRFKYFVEHESGQSMVDMLGVIQQQAMVYQGWNEKVADPYAALSSVEMCVYRSQSAKIETLNPILLWLYEPESSYALEIVTRVIALVESWLMRRVLMRLSMGDLGRVVADLIQIHRNSAEEVVTDRVETFLKGLDAVSTYWPGDQELRTALATE